MTTGNAAIPFLNSTSFELENAEEEEAEVRATTPIQSPFVSVYESIQGEGDYDDPVREAYATIVNNLYDEEFDEALFELMTDVRNLHQNHLASGYSSSEADRVVTQHFSQLVRESEAMVDAVAREFGSRDGTGLVESEIESFFGQYSPSGQIDPEFENFFGKLLKKVGSAVKGVAKGIAKIGLGPILNKIKALIKPLLNKVLQKAIGKLPEAIQPAAQKLAEKLGFAAPKVAEPATAAGGDAAIPPENAGSPVQAAAGSDLATMQQEFDEQIAGALLAQDEAELDMEAALCGAIPPRSRLLSSLILMMLATDSFKSSITSSQARVPSLTSRTSCLQFYLHSVLACV